MATDFQKPEARAVIMKSIRDHLAQSARVAPLHERKPELIQQHSSENSYDGEYLTSPLAMFRERLTSVGGHCIVAREKSEAARALVQIISELQISTPAIALSDAPLVSELARGIAAEKVSVCPTTSDLFGYDVGVTTAQAAIAETGTLVLNSEAERNRLVSLVPPVHIGIIRSEDICLTIGEALKQLGQEKRNVSRAITFITGPSRTADIELTLTVGVHGPKELYVIVIE